MLSFLKITNDEQAHAKEPLMLQVMAVDDGGVDDEIIPPSDEKLACILDSYPKDQSSSNNDSNNKEGTIEETKESGKGLQEACLCNGKT